MQNKRNAVILAAVIALLVATTAVVIPAALNALNCPDGWSRSSNGTCLQPKSDEDPALPEGFQPASAPIGPAEIAPPVAPIYVNQDISKVRPLITGVSSWPPSAGNRPLLAASISPEGYQLLLNEIGYVADRQPPSIYLSQAAAQSIGIETDTPDTLFTLSVK
jgi:hypothetical protein